MKKFKLSAMLIFAALLLFSACGGGGGGSGDPRNPGDSDDPGSDLPKKFVTDSSWETFGLFDEAVSCNCAVVNGDSIYVGTDNKGLIYSDDKGSTWKVLNVKSDGLVDDNVHSIAVSGSLVFIGTFDGLSVWDRSASSGSVKNYLSGKQINEIVIDGSIFYLATSEGATYGEVSNYGVTCTVSADFKDSNVTDIFVSDSSVYASGVPLSSGGNSMFVSKAGAVSQSYFGPASLYFGSIETFYVYGQIIVAENNWVIIRSADGGKTWTEVQNDVGGAVTGFASDGTYLYAVRYGSILSFSNDTGATWNTVDMSDSDSFAGFGAWDIVCDSGYLYISHSKGLIKGKIQ